VVFQQHNDHTDDLSKCIDTDNWGIDFETFTHIQSKFGQFTIDRFADNHNTKVSSFNSKFYCVNSLGVNAFTFTGPGILTGFVLPLA